MGAEREAALTISDREELIFLLAEASELEHGLCCCYLFAAFSLKRDPSEGLTETEHEAVARWERVITGVAIQEMLHLALASNLLTAIGAAPHLRRPNFPQRSKYYPPTVQLSLRPFDAQTLDHFIFIERPEGMEFPDAPGFDTTQAQVITHPTDGVEPVELPYASVAELYRDIEEGFKSLCASLGEERVFIGPPRAQATSAYFPFEGLTAVTDLKSALNAIELIVEQGEGLRGDIEDSHYARFLGIRSELDRLRAGRPDFEPARAVMENPFTRPPADSSGYNLIDNPEAWPIADLFNGSYALMVALLMRFFAHTEETHEELKTLVATAIGMMERVVSPLGSMLTALPATTKGDEPRAGPSFAFDRTIDYLPHRDAAWTVFDERFGELVDASAKRGLDGVHASLDSLRGRLAHHRRAPKPSATSG
ncbi:MAG TPA: ferritin-like protein [Candidatus Dormibacteraeota bacterium]|nr:ferritin-like protein [Candidatus Dormibacteraeota bacterium]